MNYLHRHDYFCNHQLEQDQASWPAIVSLIFRVIGHRDRLALKRKALGRRKRKLARRNRIRGGRL
jgi:hypothetical protein